MAIVKAIKRSGHDCCSNALVTMVKQEEIREFWALPLEDLFSQLGANLNGLTEAEAKRRLRLYGTNRLMPTKESNTLKVLLAQFKSPLILILLVAAVLSFFLNEPIDALIIIAIVMLSGVLGFWQEKRAADAVKSLLSIVRIYARLIRDGREKDVSAEEIVPGDICVLNAGDVIPGDAAIIDSKDLFVDEAALTGESFPAEKQPGVLAKDTSLMKRTNSLFMGTHVISGNARALVISTGSSTEFGRVSERLCEETPEAEFESGVRSFGYLLTRVTLLLVIAIFGITVYLQRPMIDSFLFALAIAVGIIPELLPAVISINLAVGAVQMARRKVIVKQLASIENLGSMNLLCADKTGTITEGTVKFHGAQDAAGKANEKALIYAYLNSSYQTGFTNPTDEAIRAYRAFDLTGYRKLDEVPYDFVRKRLSILVLKDGRHLMITKGAVDNVLSICSSVELSSGTHEITKMRSQIEQQFKLLGSNGYRTLGLAYKDLQEVSLIDKNDEVGMTFLALLVFFDPPKSGVVEALEELRNLGITLKVITGDNRHVATSTTRSVLGHEPSVLTGDELKLLSDSSIHSRANSIDVFAEIEPSQKERIILALRESGNTVGFLGDGINDAPALRSADVGISVNSAVDVAKEAATVVLLEKDLRVLSVGVREGRKTFANTLKYIYLTTSANFGNMFSMAGAALFLPFLPLLPKQILLNNFLTDFPAMAISTDAVDEELLEKPRPWDLRFIRNFMIVFGVISSVFDFLTFAALIFVLNSTHEEFRTGWFVESVLTEVFIIVLMRTWKPFYRSLPSTPLIVAMTLVLVVTLALPYSPLGGALGFTQLSISTLALLCVITLCYGVVTELAKRLFYVHAFERNPTVSPAYA